MDMEEERTVLVIDDSLTIRRLAEVVLSAKGYKVYTAEDGDIGLQMAKTIKPSIILVDFVMPRMNGYKLCKTIRSDPELKDIPLILITSRGEDVGQTFEEKFGVLHFFQKPFEPDELVAKIDEVLGVQSQMSHLQADSEDIEERIEKIIKTYFEKEFFAQLKNILVETLKESEVIRSENIVFSGRINHVGVPDIFQFINMTALSGKLSVLTRHAFAEVFFDSGHIVFGATSRKGYSKALTDLVIEDGRIKKKNVTEVVKKAKQKGLPIGRILVQEGYITEDELMKYLRRLTEDAIYSILDSSDGSFYFENLPLPLNLSDIKFRLSPNSLILDGLRRLDERKVAAEEFRDDEIVFKRLITEDALQEYSLDERELLIYSLIDGKRPLRDIIIQSRMDELEVKRICYSLNKVGLIKMEGG